MNDVGLWVGFSFFIIFALSIDTFVLQNRLVRPNQSMRAAFMWTLFWVSCALTFNFILWLYFYAHATSEIANDVALTFFTGYLIEKSLSVDNLFVFYMIFHHFNIPQKYQSRVFSYGIWGAIVLRLLLILFGSWLIAKFHWILYLMGLFLLLTGVKMFFAKTKKALAETKLLKLLHVLFPVTPELHKEKFFIRQNKILYITPLFITVIFIEISDLIFAFDSIPAIFSITQEPFIIWTSNIFAILGLRSIYFILASMADRFQHLKYGIAIILIFVGVKMVIQPWVQIPMLFSLGVVIGILISFILVGLQINRKKI